MGIVLGSQFTVNTTLPLDDRAVFATTTTRDLLDAGRRYEGLTVYVIADLANYQLVGGITNADWQTVGSGGGGGSGMLTSDIYDAPDATQLLTITFPTNVGTINYVVDWTLENLVDAAPSFLKGIVRSKSATGFTLELDAPTDSTNYSINYTIWPESGNILVSDTVSLASGVDSHVVTFTGDIGVSDYTVDVSFENLTDPAPLFLDYMVRARASTGFTIIFNAPTDSTNYTLNYSVRT